ncbi:hypothetical protein ACJIZ3_003921 [Penstemon smallii]|uniref:SP-RING-type domain-containing protein n=1 Tax=Penstemon smallii TaxID=265156 RepID=A0ABD3S0M9_9LAMI
MTGTTITGGGEGRGPVLTNGVKSSCVNSFRINAVIDRLSLHALGHVSNPVEFLNLCLSLARGIDFAISNQEVSARAQELPELLKQVCQKKNDPLMQAAVMVLMISVKNACQSGWFSDRDSEELRNLVKEITSNFCSVPDFNTDPNCSRSVISTIMSRFYPRMEMSHMFVFLEAKPGFDAYVSDFQISKNIKSAPGDKVRLFVVQTDSLETSSCLISPPKVNFLLNGKAVDRRTNVFVDTGPQIPTDVTHLLKYGTNLLQAVGEFDGNYIIAVALMNEVPNPDSNALQDYKQHAPAIVDPDSEVIEGSSRISLNCPISFKRIKIPVKGLSCNHIQCFDFDNYVDINSRRPSWRCPHCNQYVCFSDIRIDQKIVKILNEVGPKVTDIVLSSDGSWNTAMEIADTTRIPEDRTTHSGKNDSTQPENVSVPDTPMDVFDLTQTDDVMDAVLTHETEDRKFNPTSSQNQSTTLSMPTDLHVARTNDVINQSSPHLEDDFWSGIYISTFEQGQTAGASVSTSNQVPPLSFLPDPMTSVPNREVEAFNNALVTTSVPQSERSLPNTLQLQQYQFGNNPTITNEYGRFPSMPRNVTRNPIAVQALPVQTPTSVQQQMSRNRVNPLVQSAVSTVSQTSPIGSNPHPVPQMSSSPLLHPPGFQNVVGFPVPNLTPPHAYRALQERQASNQHMVNNRIPQSMSQSPDTMQQPHASFLRSQIHVGAPQNRGVVNAQQNLLASANRAAQMAVDPSTYQRMQSVVGDQTVNNGISSQPLPRTDSYDPADMNWRPEGRMRGALSGQAYADALNQYIIRPSQQAQATRPISNVTSPQTNVPHMADRVSHGSAAPVSRPGMH